LRPALYLDLTRWNRPAGWLPLWPLLAALWIAADGFPGWHLVIAFVLGTILMRCAGCLVNAVADREFDKRVKRTANRPALAVAIAYPYAKRFVSIPQAVLGWRSALAFRWRSQRCRVQGSQFRNIAAVGNAVPWHAWLLLAIQPVLGAGLRHRICDGRPWR
jgi:4-hydroxybenzoate polyprenyltransferase